VNCSDFWDKKTYKIAEMKNRSENIGKVKNLGP